MSKIHLSTTTVCGISGLIGCAVGATVSIFALKGKYKREAEEEIEAVREVYRKQRDRDRDRIKKAAKTGKEPFGRYKWDDEPTSEEVTQFDMKSFQKDNDDILKRGKYTSSISAKESDITEDDNRPDIYVIPQKDFGDDHSKVFLTYFTADRTLLDDAGDIVAITKDAEGHDILSIPEEILEHVGDEEEDVVYCRNDNLGIDYEITFVDMASTDIPRPREVRYE